MWSSKHVLVDFSSPNYMKNMNTCQFRSSIHGDSICRVFKYSGCKASRVSHVGDFSKHMGVHVAGNANELSEQARTSIQRLRGGDLSYRKHWKDLSDESRAVQKQIYSKLDIKLNEVGESFYYPMLEPKVYKELLESGFARQETTPDICIDQDDEKNKIKEINTLTIQQATGDFN